MMTTPDVVTTPDHTTPPAGAPAGTAATPAGSASKPLSSRWAIICLFGLTNLIFCILYGRFILGDVYMYADIGNDSLSSSYPLLVMLSRLFHEGGFTAYNLTNGLGTDITALCLQYVNPVKLIMLLFPTAALPQAILFSTFIQVNLLSLFGWIFFKALLLDKTTSGNSGSLGKTATPAGTNTAVLPGTDRTRAFIPVIPTLIWTFSAYVVLWGQNYSFLTCILMFTMIMALLELYLQDASPKKWLWFIPTTALFLMSNYYFLFMTAIFAAVYFIFRSIFTRLPVKAFFKKLAVLAGMAIMGCVMGCVSLLPILNSVLSSNRFDRLAENAAQTSAAPSMFYGPRAMLTFLGRLFSANTFGPGSGYTGFENYYEAAVLSVSVLFIFALVFLILRKSTRIRALGLLILSVVLLAIPRVSTLLNMNATAQRWSFMLCFAACIVIGIFVKTILTEDCRKTIFPTLIIAPLLSALCLGLVYLGVRRGYYQLSPKPVAICMGMFLLFEMVLLVGLMLRKRKMLLPGILVVLTLELIFSNYMTINDRMYLSQEAFYHAFYNDGSGDVIDTVKTADTDLYRIENDRQTDPALYGITAQAPYMFANEGMVNNFNSLSIYSSTIPASLTSYGNAYRSELGRSNFFIVDFNDYYTFTLLGGRYAFGNKDNLFVANADGSLYDDGPAAGTNIVVKNANALPFGYLYDELLTDSDRTAMDALTLMRASTRAVFATDSSDESKMSLPQTYDASTAPAERLIPLADCIEKTNDCEVSVENGQLTVTATGVDPYICFILPPYDMRQSLFLTLSKAGDDAQPLQLFMATTAHPDMDGRLCRDYTLPDDRSEAVMAMPEGLTNLRIDTVPGSVITFDLAAFHVVDSVADFKELSASPVTDISYQENGLTATYQAVASPETDSILCVPFPYSGNWTAKVDGASTEVLNVNGGLTGIHLTPGTHNVTLIYSPAHFGAAALVSLIGCLAFIILYVVVLRKHRRQAHITD
ncbi:MAG: YfhO family protein [Lachnospiraceae bacterium]|nr:YfhO family protein [Lachnospiraceae bacterium]